MATTPTSTEVGEFIDTKTVGHPRRTPVAVVGRLIEEITELALELGMKPGKIFEHITDALANEAIKLSQRETNTIYPSELPSFALPRDGFVKDISIASEIVDVRLVLKDLIHVLKFIPEKIDQAELAKWQKFTEQTFRVSDKGNLYTVKPHVK
jgi:hypothetical protein